MSKVWNIVGSYFGGSNLIPEGAEYIDFSVDPNSLDTYYDGELFRMDLTYFVATFRTLEGKLLSISIPSSQVIPDPDSNTGAIISTPFVNNTEYSTTIPLRFGWTYTWGDNQSKYLSNSNDFNITIWPEKFTVKKVDIIVPPNKTKYYNGEIFDHTGMVVQATSEEGDTKEINHCKGYTCTADSDCYYYSKTPFNASNNTSNGTQRVYFTYCIPADGDNPHGHTAEFYYDVVVYEDERKPQLKVTVDPSFQNMWYYSGTKVENLSQYIKVQFKYPKDDDSVYDQEGHTVTNRCNFSIKEFPSGTVYYNDENNGNLTINISFLDDQEVNGNEPTNMTVYYEIADILHVYEVDRLEPDTSIVSNKTYNVGSVFNKSEMPLRVYYKPAEKGYIDNADYNIVADSNIDSTGKFKIAGDSIKVTFYYVDDKDLTNKSHSFVQYFRVAKKITPITKPSQEVRSFTYDESSGGIAFLTKIGITQSSSSTVRKEGIGIITVDGSDYTYNLAKLFTASSSKYQYLICVNLITDNSESDTIYTWTDGTTDPVYITVNVKVKKIVTLTANPSSVYLSYDYSTNRGTTQSSTISASDGKSYLVSTTGYSNYITTNKQSGNTPLQISYTAQSSGDDSDRTTSFTYRASTTSSSDAWSETIINSSPTVTVHVSYENYKEPWSWDEELSADWVRRLKDNNPSQYIGRYKDIPDSNDRFYLLDINGSNLIWGSFYATGPFLNSSQTLAAWSSGTCKIQTEANSFANYVDNYFGTLKSQTRQIRYDSSATSKTYSMKAWPPSAEELGISVGETVNSNKLNTNRFSSGNVFHGTFWLCNGGIANNGGGPDSGPNVSKSPAFYNQSIQGTDKAAGTTSHINYVFCFEC